MSRMRIWLSAAIVVLLSSSAGPASFAQSLPAAPAAITALEKGIPELMAQARIPGVSIALIRNGRVAWHRGFGVASAATKEPVDDGTIFEAASLSKPVFAYGVLKLADRRLIDLDAPLSKYLSEPYINDDRVKLITARMVLSHTTGFPNWRPRGQDLRIHFTPGEKFSYSGEGYVYLQKVVEKIAGKPANDFMSETVFQPLGMAHSSYLWKEEYDRLSAQGHDLFGAAMPKNKPSEMRSASSLHTTALEYAQFVTAIMNGTGLAAGTAARMLATQSRVDPDCIFCTDNKPPRVSDTLSWGFGWGLEKAVRTDYFWHWGDNGPFRCFVIASTKNRAGVVMFTNSINGLSIIDEIVRISLGGDHPAIRWTKYDQYDSPAGKLVAGLLQDGAERAIQSYLAGREKSGWPVPAENLVNSLGYSMLRARKFDDAVRLFQWNVELYPTSANTYDSLGEAHAARGEKELAIWNYRKSLELNPSNQNARDKLKELEAPERHLTSPVRRASNGDENRSRHVPRVPLRGTSGLQPGHKAPRDTRPG